MPGVRGAGDGETGDGEGGAGHAPNNELDGQTTDQDNDRQTLDEYMRERVERHLARHGKTCRIALARAAGVVLRRVEIAVLWNDQTWECVSIDIPSTGDEAVRYAGPDGAMKWFHETHWPTPRYYRAVAAFYYREHTTGEHDLEPGSGGAGSGGTGSGGSGTPGSSDGGDQGPGNSDEHGPGEHGPHNAPEPD